MKNKNKVLIFLLVLVLVLAACDGKGSSGDEKVKEKENNNSKDSIIEEFVYASTTDVSGLSPILTNDSVSADVQEHIYETLFIRDGETGELKGLLAEKYENPDELTWLITLRDGIEFHDGTPFNAEAVKYTFDKLRDPATAAPRASLLEPVDSIEVKDNLTVIIKTKYPYGPFMTALSHSNAAIVSPTADQEQDLMSKPVGTGPFIFESHIPGDRVVLKSNPNYREGEPTIKKLVFKVVPEMSTAISMLQTGDVDLLTSLPSEQIGRIESLKNITVEKKEGSAVYYLTANHSKERANDPNFRKAIVAAIDRDSFFNNLNGLGVRSNSILGPKVFGFKNEKDFAGQNFDLELAKKLVEENNFSAEPIKILTASRDNFILMAEIVQAQLTEAGFKVEIEMMEWATFLETARNGNYDLTFLSWSNLTQDGSEMFYPNFHSDNVGNSNRAQLNFPEFDELVELSKETIDQEKREEYLDKANELLLENDIVVSMYHSVVTAAMNEQYKGLQLEANGRWNVSQITKK